MARIRIVRVGGTAFGRLRLLALSGAMVLALGAVITLALGAFVDTEGVCGDACHSMRPYAAATADGAHRGIGCAQCHTQSGVFGSLADGWALERRLVAAVLGREPSAVMLSDGACRSCHHAVEDSTFVSRGISVRHSDFLDEQCTVCHGGTGHTLEQRVYDVPQMDDCMTCHSSSGTELTGCDVCHAQEADRDRLKRTSTWRITHGKEWRTTHGMGDLGTCVSCHVPTYCARCHIVSLPHPRAWAREHGGGATAVGVKPCHTCHEQSWCTDCHGVEMPHPDSFLPGHGSVAERIGEDACGRCHPQASCDDCHLRSSHPDIPGVESIHTGSTGGGS